ncbi:MAG: EamA family transporter [Ignavibacteriaceae bacterium]|nr:EamA family transporter [Ignavibacteriaceae bacterium]
MLYLLLTILSSSSIALILKYNTTRKNQPVVMLMGNYFIASIISAIMIFIKGNAEYSNEALFFGLILGPLFIISFFIFAKAVEFAGTALATVSSRLSVVIPVFLVVVFFGEIPNTHIYLGFSLTILTIILFYLSLNHENSGAGDKKKYFFLIGVLLFIGVNDFAMKFFQLLRTSGEESFFVYMIFTTAFIVGAAVIFTRKIKIEKSEFLTGLVLGIPNYFSTVFLLAALSTLPAMIVYPVINTGVIIVTTLAAYLIFKEKLNYFGIAALILGTVAILLLGV